MPGYRATRILKTIFINSKLIKLLSIEKLLGVDMHAQRLKTRTFWQIVVGVASTVAGVSAHALPPPDYEISVFAGVIGRVGNGTGIDVRYNSLTDPAAVATDPKSIGYSYTSPLNSLNGRGGYTVSASALSINGGSVHAIASGDGDFEPTSNFTPKGDVEANATLHYFFELVGPGTGPLLLGFNAKLSTSTIGSGYASAELDITSGSDPNSFQNRLVHIYGDSEKYESSAAQGGIIFLTPNVVYSVTETVIVANHLFHFYDPTSPFYDPRQDQFSSGSADAYVDPTFVLSPQDAKSYHFEGLLAAPVPEPASYSLLAIGLVGLIVARRRGTVEAQPHSVA